MVRPLDPSVNGGPNRPKADRFASWRPSENTSAERSPTVLQAIEKKKIEFAVDQQEYLQGYLPVVVLANYSRYGLIQANDVIRRGETFITSQDAKRVIELGKKRNRQGRIFGTGASGGF